MSHSNLRVAIGMSLEGKKVQLLKDKYAQSTTVFYVLPFCNIQGENRVMQEGSGEIFFKDLFKLMEKFPSCIVSQFDPDDPLLTQEVFDAFESGSMSRKRKAAELAEEKIRSSVDTPDEGSLSELDDQKEAEERPRPKPRRQKAADNSGLCVVCQDKKAVFCPSPCNHVTYCEVCHPTAQQATGCPICREAVRSWSRIYFP